MKIDESRKEVDQRVVDPAASCCLLCLGFKICNNDNVIKRCHKSKKINSLLITIITPNLLFTLFQMYFIKVSVCLP